MTFLELIDVIVLTGVVTVLLTLFWQRIRALVKTISSNTCRPGI